MTEQRMHCSECSRNVLARSEDRGWIGDFIVVVLTFGLMLPLVLLHRLVWPNPFRCPICGLDLSPRYTWRGALTTLGLALLVTFGLLSACLVACVI